MTDAAPIPPPEPEGPGVCDHCSALVARWAIGERGGICPVCGNQWVERMHPARPARIDDRVRLPDGRLGIVVGVDGSRLGILIETGGVVPAQAADVIVVLDRMAGP